jgi:hypothetical protein
MARVELPTYICDNCQEEMGHFPQVVLDPGSNSEIRTTYRRLLLYAKDFCSLRCLFDYLRNELEVGEDE